MTSHSIKENETYHRFSDYQSGANSRPSSDGRYYSVNNYERQVRKTLRAQRNIRYDRRYAKYSTWDALTCSLPSYSPQLPSETWLLAKAKVKLHTAFDSVQLAKDMAEACSASCNFFARIPGTIRLLRKKQYGSAFKYLTGSRTKRQFLPNTWLQYQWAVKPLIEEIEDLWERLKDPAIPTYKISAAQGVSDSDSIERVITRYNKHITSYIDRKANKSVKVVRYFRESVLDNPNFSFSPLNAIWDGVAWSFLVDWFIPVSDVLRSLSYTPVGCISGFNNYRYSAEQKVTGVSPYQIESDDGRYTYRLEWPDNMFRTFKFTRTFDTTLSLSYSQIKELLWNSPAGLTLKRTLNLFAVAQAAASSK